MVLVRFASPVLGDPLEQLLRFLRLVAIFYAAGHVVPGVTIWLIGRTAHAL
ncbi:hypothetical protein P1J78_11260 [Psychromarinibacter sp. C21-152]|uniref:Uncharacterized protein n=1 Tax=Psychromarinibacter sediminicola TaxID=3033385 RepID=A0AAE3T8D8_9RHOB|nr:hypothetical protein [Psychromarinibacter sediminicola]MDF0601310.1 hypothetical protein [Psychromarinibacter sediminicola]